MSTTSPQPQASAAPSASSTTPSADPIPSPAEWDYRKNVESEQIKAGVVESQQAHWMEKHNLDAVQSQKQRDHEELQRVRNHEEAQRKRDFVLRTIIVCFFGVGVLAGSWLLVKNGYVREAVGLILLVGSNAATYVFGHKPSSSEVLTAEVKRFLGGLPSAGQLPAKAEDGKGATSPT